MAALRLLRRTRAALAPACRAAAAAAAAAAPAGARAVSQRVSARPTVLAYLYPDPSPEGLPPLQRSPPAGPERWPDGQRLPRWPAAATAAGAPPPPPGALLGCVSGALGLTELVTEVLSAEYVTTCDPAEADAALGGAEVVMSQPFWPLYLDRARLEAAENLKLVITAGVGSDHIDLAACRELGVDVVEITQSNSSSVAEHAVMQALGLVRNYIPSNREVHRVWGQALPDPASARLQPSSVAPGWDIAACASRSYDVMGLNVGTVGCGRIARGILDRLSPFDVANFMYTERARLPPVKEHQLGLGKGAHYFEEVADMLPHCDLVFINCPLTAQTDGLFSADLIAKMKRGAYLVNTARGRVCDQDAVVEALRSGQLGGYAGDVWFPQPAPADHPWRDPSLPTAMTPHISGTSLDAQHRYASGVAEVLWEFYKGEKDWLECYNVVRAGKPAGVGAASYTEEALDPVAQK